MLAIALTLLFSASTALAAPVDIKREYPHDPVSWAIDFHGKIMADTVMELEWKGGSGAWEIYYIPQWEGQDDYTPVDIANSTTNAIKWHTPKIDAYPPGTTFIMVVNDAYSAMGAKWFDTTPLLQFIAE